MTRKKPNAETLKAIHDIDAGIGVEAITIEELGRQWEEADKGPSDESVTHKIPNAETLQAILETEAVIGLEPVTLEGLARQWEEADEEDSDILNDSANASGQQSRTNK